MRFSFPVSDSVLPVRAVGAQESTVKIIKIKNVAVSACLFFGVSAQANMLENLADVANGALPSYGRVDVSGHGGVIRSDLTETEVTDALRELLSVACDNVAVKLERYGYNSPAVRIELPKKWRKARKIAARIGYTSEFDKLEREIAAIAVAIAPDTRDLLVEMIDDLDISDPFAVIRHQDGLATAELRAQMTRRLAGRLQPLVSEILASSGVIRVSDDILRQVKHLPLIKIVETDFTNHIVDESLEGFFHYLAIEEKAIRLQPLDQQSDLLQRVFG